jgi:cation transport ATPase
MAKAGRHGVLVKSAVVMEQLGATTLVRSTRPAP